MEQSWKTQDSQNLGVVLARLASTIIPPYPRLAPWLSIVDISGGRLHLRSTESALMLSDPALVATALHLLPHLDGTGELGDILAAMNDRDDSVVNPDLARLLLQILATNGMLVASREIESPLNSSESSLNHQIRAIRHLAADPIAVQATVSAARVVVVAGRDDLGRSVAKAIGSLGAGNVTVLSPPSFANDWTQTAHDLRRDFSSLLVGVGDPMSRPLLRSINQAALEAKIRWTAIEVGPIRARIGPTMIPGQTACFACYESRERCQEGTLAAGPIIRGREIVRPTIDPGSIRPLTAIAANLLALEVLRILTGVCVHLSLLEGSRKSQSSTLNHVLTTY